LYISIGVEAQDLIHANQAQDITMTTFRQISSPGVPVEL
jgi:hypothetical protein